MNKVDSNIKQMREKIEEINRELEKTGNHICELSAKVKELEKERNTLQTALIAYMETTTKGGV